MRVLARIYPLYPIAILLALGLAVNAHASIDIDVGCTAGVGDSAGLVAAINLANAVEGGTISLSAGCTYTFTQADNFWYGPDALPPIQSTITVEGNGATLLAAHSGDPTPSTANAFRFFYVSGGMESSAGTLSLHDLTLRGGYAKGGGSVYGGAGAGMGGAIFNQGTLILNAVSMIDNTAQGGGNTGVDQFGGGGMGQDPPSAIGHDQGGGMGGNLPGAFIGLSVGGNGSGNGGGGGGGGFLSNADGVSATANNGGPGGGLGHLGGGCYGCTATLDDGGSGGSGTTGGANGGGFGREGTATAEDASGGGGGGGGTGGGGGFGYYVGGGGGFGGGGGSGAEGVGGGGGFGGGGGATSPGGAGGGHGGFGGGDGSSGGFGGGGAGMGGAIFNHTGSVRLIDVTLTGNAANGGTLASSGSGLGAAIFNLNGTVDIAFSTIAKNSVSRSNGAPLDGGPGDGAIYSLAYGNDIQHGIASGAILAVVNSIVYGTVGATHEIVNNAVDGRNVNLSLLRFSGGNIVDSYQNASFLDANSTTPLTTDPQLGPLSATVNAPMTLPISAQSPAYNAADSCNDADGNPVLTDERGIARPQSSQCDLGAYEYDGDYIFANGFD